MSDVLDYLFAPMPHRDKAPYDYTDKPSKKKVKKKKVKKKKPEDKTGYDMFKNPYDSLFSGASSTQKNDIARELLRRQSDPAPYADKTGFDLLEAPSKGLLDNAYNTQRNDVARELLRMDRRKADPEMDETGFDITESPSKILLDRVANVDRNRKAAKAYSDAQVEKEYAENSPNVIRPISEEDLYGEELLGMLRRAEADLPSPTGEADEWGSVPPDDGLNLEPPKKMANKPRGFFDDYKSPSKSDEEIIKTIANGDDKDGDEGSSEGSPIGDIVNETKKELGIPERPYVNDIYAQAVDQSMQLRGAPSHLSRSVAQEKKASGDADQYRRLLEMQSRNSAQQRASDIEMMKLQLAKTKVDKEDVRGNRKLDQDWNLGQQRLVQDAMLAHNGDLSKEKIASLNSMLKTMEIHSANGNFTAIKAQKAAIEELRRNMSKKNIMPFIKKAEKFNKAQDKLYNDLYGKGDVGGAAALKALEKDKPAAIIQNGDPSLDLEASYNKEADIERRVASDGYWYTTE